MGDAGKDYAHMSGHGERLAIAIAAVQPRDGANSQILESGSVPS
jgi:hypothetical protein